MNHRILSGLLLMLILASAGLFAQKTQAPAPPLPLCEDLQCLEVSENVTSLNLKRKYRKGGIPDTNKIKDLLWLDLSGNKLNQVPDWVCDCANLQYLNLSRNRINSLPDCLGQLKNLQYFSASRNPLGGIPKAMAQCTKLEYLDLWQTWIDYFPWELHVLNKHLKVIDLRDITMTQEQQMAIYKVFPDPELRLSAWCNCAQNKRKR